MKSFHALFFFIALLLFFFSSASPQPSLASLFKRHLTYRSLNDENVPLKFPMEIPNEENSEVDPEINAAMEAQKINIGSLTNYYYLPKTDPHVKVGHIQQFLFHGKKIFQNGTRSEYQWKVNWKESSVENLLIGLPKLHQQEKHDAVSDLFSTFIVPLEEGHNYLKLEEIRDSDKHVRETTTVGINSLITDTVFINKRKTRELNSLVDSPINFTVRVDPDKPDYKWVIDSSGTSPNLKIGHFSDLPNYWEHYLIWYPLQNVVVTPTTAGTHILKLSYQKPNGKNVQMSTVTIRVTDESPKYIADKEVAMQAYNQMRSSITAATSLSNEDPIFGDMKNQGSSVTFLNDEKPVFIKTNVGFVQSAVVQGKLRFQNGTVNEYVWEADLTQSSKYLIIGPSSVYRESGFDDVPDFLMFPFIQIEEGNQNLLLRLIRSRDKDIKENRTLTISGVIHSLAYLNDKPITRINTIVNNEMFFFVNLDRKRRGYDWVVYPAVLPTSLKIGTLVDSSDYGRKGWAHWQATKNVNVTGTQRGESRLKFIYKNRRTQILRECLVIMNVS